MASDGGCILSAWYSTEAAERKLTPSGIKLLKTIASRDYGNGVVFETEPRSRWRLHGTTLVFNAQTFRTLVALALIDVGDGHGDPVRITDAGRTALGEMS